MIHYTVGQRKGLGIALGYPAFVLEIRPKTNEIVLGNDEESLTTTCGTSVKRYGSGTFDEMEGQQADLSKIRYESSGRMVFLESDRAG